jgi:hypothetical protein
MFLRFLRMCFWATAVPALLAVIVLIPIYATGGNNDPAAAGYNEITIANLKPSSARLWAPLIFWYCFVAWFLFCLYKEWEAFLPLRWKYLAEGDVDTDPEYRFTLLIENIPVSKRSAGMCFICF